MIDSKELLKDLERRLDACDLQLKELTELRKGKVRKNCGTCSGIDCNNSVEWECDPTGKAKHWNPSFAYIKIFFNNPIVLKAWVNE